MRCDEQMMRLAAPVDARDHVLGNPASTTTLVWYGDYECPHCKCIWPVLKSLVDSLGRCFRLVYRHFPTNTLNASASIAAQASEAAAAQKRFWEMHELLLGHQDRLGETSLTHLALAAGLEVYRFSFDLSIQRYASRVRRDMESGLLSGVTATPTLFINDAPFCGDYEAASLQQALLATAREAGVSCDFYY